MESPKKATLMSFMHVFTQYKTQYLKTNQYLLLTEFTSAERNNSNNLFVGEAGQEQLDFYIKEMKWQYKSFMTEEKQICQINFPPELDYTISYIIHISRCCLGKIVISETRA